MNLSPKSMRIIAANHAFGHALHGGEDEELQMKRVAATIASLFLVTSSAQAEQPNIAGRRLSPDDVRSVAPALEKYTQERLYGGVWERPGLSRRKRSIVTIAASLRAISPCR
jgi:alkylhydroperoxidase/carboxymuconolactone decarboxylase family protein YurZ